MNYLIFRTDRIGDFLITLPFIKSIKRNKPDSKIFVVASPKNEEFIKSNIFVDNIFVLKKNDFYNKIKLYFELRKIFFEAIIVSDKKNRSLLIALFLKSKIKIFNTSKFNQKNILSFFFKNVFIDNDSFKNISKKDINEKNCKSLGMVLNEGDYNFFLKNQFINYYNYNDQFDLDQNDYIVFHYDEKWEIDNYARLFSKAKNFTKIKINLKIFQNFLKEIENMKKIKIIITTGFIETDLVDQLKGKSERLISSFYKINDNSFLITDQNFNSISHLISKSKIFISCHGAFTHIAANYNIKILDIIEKNKQHHYSRITNHMKNYVSLNRNNFNVLSKDIIGLL